MSERRILVVGATGAQGGSVARHLLAGGNCAVRCLTRNPESTKASALAENGAEIVKGDLSDPDSLHTAIKDCWGVFGVTNFWEHFNEEFQQGKNLVDVVRHAGVEHFVFSTLPFISKLTKGELLVPHFDFKGQLEEYTRNAGLGATFVHVAFYYENWLSYFPPQKEEDGTWAFGFPQGDTRLAAVSCEDLGGVVSAIFDDPSTYKSQVVGVVGDDRPAEEYAQIMTRTLGKTMRYNHIPKDVFASFDFPGAEDLANMFEYNRLHIPDRRADLEESRSLYPMIQNFEEWLNDNQGLFKLE